MTAEKENQSRGEGVSPFWYWVIGACALVSLVGLAVLEPFRVPQPAKEEIEVSGCVIHADGTPVQSFEIVLFSERDRKLQRLPFSDTHGRYTFAVRPGRYRIKCVSEEGESEEEPLEVHPRSERVWHLFTLGR